MRFFTHHVDFEKFSADLGQKNDNRHFSSFFFFLFSFKSLLKIFFNENLNDISFINISKVIIKI